MGAALSLALVGLASTPVMSTSVPPSEASPSETAPLIIPPFEALPPEVAPLNIPASEVFPSSETTPVVTDEPLSYKLETFNSKVMGGRRTYGVALPPGYAQNSQKRYPVIFLLHGGSGNPNSWFEREKGSALVTLQKLYAAGKLPPSIIITPDGYDQRGTSRYRDPAYIDGPNSRILTHIGDELVKVVQSRYRTLPAPNYWAIGGLSSGGWGAVNIGLNKLNHFSILFSHSGYFRDKSGSRNSPIDLVRKLTPQQLRNVKIYLDAGTEDSFSLNQNRQFNTTLKQLKITNVMREFPGEHSWRYWRQHLTDSLTFVGEQFQQKQ